MPALGLDSSLLTNVPSIDREHFDLISLLDSLINNPNAHPDTEVFSEVLGQLGCQIGAHIKNEESILKSFTMPEHELLSHIQAHSDILNQYVQMNLDMIEDKTLSRADALLTIRHWVITHLLEYDLRIRDYVRKT